MNRSLFLAGRSYTLSVFKRGQESQEILDKEKDAVFRLFTEREKEEFSCSPSVLTHYPDIQDPDSAAFLAHPAHYILKRAEDVEKREGKAVTHVVILTTYGDRLAGPLESAGYRPEKIIMPAGPDHTFAFYRRRTVEPVRQEQKTTLYIEAVNENDEKIRPSFVLKLTDGEGTLCGGMCGSVSEQEGRRYAYIATLVVKRGMPPFTGSRLAAERLDFLRTEGAASVTLGTQTASRFYEKQGFSTIHSIVSDVRRRVAADGRTVRNDLVIMRKDLSNKRWRLQK